MSKSELHDELKALVADIIEIDDFGDDDNFVTQLGVDSVMALEIMARIEKNYHIRVPEDFFAQMKSLNEVVRITTEIMQPVNS
ncbi:MAG: acyl carrier protein [Ktedonobacteraceae bacterium]|nr:acyl carrier protein [Ktedonobacteraceae bacterium]